ncbi:MAG: epoxyqueuosine reductase QueH [Clostridia bacterium]|nr:epoxyqueuosine reductase QueH [Clostridia bacterium]
MPKINYYLEMEKEIGRIRREGSRPSLALHACCAPCSSAVLMQLADVFDITVFFYNPNISPEAEFRLRLEEQIRLINEMLPGSGIRVEAGDYEEKEFYRRVKGHEKDPEGGERCGICFDMRLRKTAEFARQHRMDYFTTTLSISPLKDAQRLNALGGALAEEYGVKYLFSDFKKKEGYKRSCALSQEYGLYRQDYCGCVFSKMEREAAKEN